MKGLAKLLLGVIIGIAGLGTIGFIGIRTGHITIILGNDNKVDNRDQSEPREPAKPLTSEIKRESQVAQPTAPSRTQPSVEEASEQPRPIELAHARRTHSIPTYEPDEECSCPIEEQSDPEPKPQRVVYPTYVSNPAPVVVAPDSSQYQTQSSRVYVQSGSSATVRTSVTAGQRSRTRIVVNGQVVVDE